MSRNSRPHILGEHSDASSAAPPEPSMLRFVTIGSVDDGKSTLIGRLLYESGAIYDDQLEAITTRSADGDSEIAFANLTDGLVAEREQGITIDVAYRYFGTSKRKFIIADTPGHLQYTRNMVTGASTADAAIILIDARHGVLQQSRRHAYIASLLGIRHLIVAINKMDLVDYDAKLFQGIAKNFRELASNLVGQTPTEDTSATELAAEECSLYFVPISALRGDNIVKPSTNTPWYPGPTVLQLLEELPLPSSAANQAFAMPVQLVLRPDQDYRGYAGNICAGSITAGDPVVAWPSGRSSRVRSISQGHTSPPRAHAPMAIQLELEDELDISRGDILAAPERALLHSSTIEATLVWMGEKPLVIGRSYQFKHAHRLSVGTIQTLHSRQNMDRLEAESAATLELNDIGEVTVHLQRPWTCDRYRNDRNLGSFIIIDRLSHATVAAGLINASASSAQEIDDQKIASMDADERASKFGQRPALLCFHTSPPQRADALAIALERTLLDRGHFAYLLPHAHEDRATPESQPAVETLLDAGLLLLQRASAGDKAAQRPPALACGRFSRLDILLGPLANASALPHAIPNAIEVQSDAALELQVECVLHELIARDLIDARYLDRRRPKLAGPK